MTPKIIPVTLVTLMLAACNSQKDASNATFANALEKHLAGPGSCITIKPFVSAADRQSYPMTVTLFVKKGWDSQSVVDQNNAIMTRQLDPLVKAGVLSVAPGKNSEAAPARIYSLTDAGQKAIESADSTAMCVGHYKVDEVASFTQPETVNGQTTSRVIFTASPVDVPDWAKRQDVQNAYSGLADALAPQIKSARTLVLASDGWIDAAEFRQ
ncbi:hypothetical protein [Paraburkholderia sp. J8-2]|uniref:hypothetical protein n=1 Tax=Paraburkholderia sp. J8-2 TaxID=2805440 RepID=UPI002AB79FAD|nr:hypothetical protein [Paraburkholderia sp. J8-2]